tara:strand:- start:241 stop:519 length:279 start_codon:yes stop_codon:yes gene_type:complete
LHVVEKDLMDELNRKRSIGLETNNSSGFNAFPEGYRGFNGSFSSEGNDASFWSSTESSTDHAWYRTLYGYSRYLDRSNDYKQFGFSVRFVRD